MSKEFGGLSLSLLLRAAIDLNLKNEALVGELGAETIRLSSFDLDGDIVMLVGLIADDLPESLRGMIGGCELDCGFGKESE